MAKQKRYFCNGFVNRIIRFRAPDAWELRNPGQRGQFFDTWAEAHAWLLELREQDVKDAEKQLANARVGLKRAQQMKEALDEKPDGVAPSDGGKQ